MRDGARLGAPDVSEGMKESRVHHKPEKNSEDIVGEDDARYCFDSNRCARCFGKQAQSECEKRFDQARQSKAGERNQSRSQRHGGHESCCPILCADFVILKMSKACWKRLEGEPT